MDRRRYLATVSTGALAGLAGCGSVLGSEDETPDEYDIGMGAAFFDPNAFTVSVGDTVVWRNTGSRAHTVTAYDNLPEGAQYFASGGFDSADEARDAWRTNTGGAIFSGETYEHTFRVPGKYNYFCVPHERTGMVGVITVEE